MIVLQPHSKVLRLGILKIINQLKSAKVESVKVFLMKHTYNFLNFINL